MSTVQCPCINMTNFSFDLSNMRCKVNKSNGFCSKHTEQLKEFKSLDEYTTEFNDCKSITEKNLYNKKIFEMICRKIMNNAKEKIGIDDKENEKKAEKLAEDLEKFKIEKQKFENERNLFNIRSKDFKIEQRMIDSTIQKIEAQKKMFKYEVQGFEQKFKLPSFCEVDFIFKNFFNGTSENVEDKKEKYEKDKKKYEKQKSKFEEELEKKNEELKKSFDDKITQKIQSNLKNKKFSDACIAIGIQPQDFPSLTEKIIKSNYRKKILTDHPDKGGSADKFIVIQDSFEYIQSVIN